MSLTTTAKRKCCFTRNFPCCMLALILHVLSFLNILIPAQYRPPIPTPDTKPGYPQHRSLPLPSIPKPSNLKNLKFRSPIYRLSYLPISKERKNLLLRTRCQCVILISQIPGLITWQSIQRRFPTPICWNWKNWKNCIPNEYQYQISPQDQHHPPHPEPPFLIRKISISQMKIVTKNIWLITMNNNDLTWDRRSHRKGRRCWLYNSSIDNFDFVVLIRSRGKIACTDGVVMSCSCCVRYTWDRGLRIESKPIDRGK